MADLTDYTGLITSQHKPRPKFMATVEALTQPLVDLQNLLASMPGKFDLDTASDAQLDDVGLWVGISRNVPVPLAGVYFSLDTDGLGFDQGSWKGPFDPDAGLTRLDNETYRLVLRAKIGANHWDGTLESSAAILNSIFGNPGTDLVPVHADGEVFGHGDGATRNFGLTYEGAQIRSVGNATLRRNDWQGDQLLYATPRENFIANSTYAAGSWIDAAGSGITFSPGVSAPDGSNTAVRCDFTTATGSNCIVRVNNPTSLPAGTYTGSFWCRLVSGSPGALGTDISDYAPGGERQFTPTSSWQRVTGVPLVWSGGTVFFDLISNTNPGFVIDLWGVQIEAGSQDTSYIPTTGTAVTVTDYVLNSGGVVGLAVAPVTGAALSWSGDGAIYPAGSRVFIQDNQDMSMTIGVAGKVPSAVFLALLAGGYIPLKPAGVRINDTIVTSVDGDPIFGFDVQNQYIAGFDTGAWGTPL